MDISNKTLAVLLIAGMVLSIGGTVITLNSGGLTGYAGSSDTDTGTVNYSVSSNVVIDFTTDSVVFGTGYVNTTGGVTDCTLRTESAHDSECVDFTPSGSVDALAIENIGNKDVELNITFPSAVTDLITFDGSGSMLELKASDSEVGSCSGTQDLSSYVDANAYDSGTYITACGTFESDPGTNSVNLDVQLTIDKDESGTNTIGMQALGTEI